MIFSHTDKLMEFKQLTLGRDKGFYCNSRIVRGGTISKSYDKGLVSRFKVDTFAQADINSFCIMVDIGDGQVRVA